MFKISAEIYAKANLKKLFLSYHLHRKKLSQPGSQ